MISRRTALAVLSAGISLPRFAVAQVTVGEGTLMTVSDGHLVLPGEFVFEPIPDAELLPVLAGFDVDAERLTPECNLALLRTGGRVVLFDAGAGPDFMPTTGLLLDALDAAGIAPAEVTDVVFTHAHPDHIWGALDDFGDVTFAEATHHVGAVEHAYWSNPTTVETIGEARVIFAIGAARRLEAIGDRLSLFEPGAEVVPGVEAVSTPGHTPGHMSFLVGDVLVIGDAIANHHVAFEQPSWPLGSDQDQVRAAETRVALFDRITADELTIVGFHLPDGGTGRVEPAGDGYRFVAG